ncbi:MAG TPA: type IVB secretion system protein IcmH/DotU [Acidobacteriota bacterium]|nr:type IVB secretion system protein IcmH/DotU [Acidobacteriota bacterium]
MNGKANAWSGALTRACRRGFSLILNLQTGADFGDPVGLRQRIAEMFAALERETRGAGVPVEQILSARFALTAFIDEAINRSDWPGRAAWSNRPLSLEYFNTNRAGDEFFDRLEALRARPEAHGDLLEVYHTCLALGFEGKYALADPRRLQELIEATARDVDRLRGSVGGLSPHWQAPEQAFERFRNEVPLWVFSAVLLAAVFVAFVVFRYLGTSQARDLAESLSRAL